MHNQYWVKFDLRTTFYRCLVVAVLFALAAGLAWSQVSATTLDPMMFRPNTPDVIKSGRATLVEHYDSNKMLRLTLALQPPHWVEEQEYLQKLQTKGSAEFLHYLSTEEWNARFSPSVADEQAVVNWATAQGLTVTQRYPNRLLVDVVAKAGTIEQAFHVTINSYLDGSRSFYSNDRDPELPSSMTSILQALIGLDNWMLMHPANRNVKEPAIQDYVDGPSISRPATANATGSRTALSRALQAHKNGVRNITGGAYDPTDIYSSEAYDYNALYNLGHCCNPLGNAGSSPPEASIAIVTVGSQNFSDMAGFQSAYPYLAYSINEFGIDGQSVPCTDSTDATCDGEGTLDMEWTTATANSFGSYQNTAHVYLYDVPNFGSFPDAYNAELSGGLARVGTTSWSCTERDCGSSFMSTLNTIFANMAGAGWTLLAAQGDRGATDDCSAAIDVAFPGSNPYVVSAGGTTLSLDSFSNYVSEVTWTGGPSGCGSNDGGTGGGCSAVYSAPGYQSSPYCGSGSRSVPDLALNADWFNTPQNMYFHGLGGNGGTSIVAPELAGFYAQENAYLLYIQSICASCGTIAPVGDPHYELYDEGYSHGAPHIPFYDITSGDNCNDVTTFYSLGCYFAGSGYDAVTGWGSANMLQLAWATNWYHIIPLNYPTVNFSGPATGVWYNGDVEVTWTIGGLTGEGTAGFSQAWDSDSGNPTSEATPGAGNSFYSGPQYPNATGGCLDFTGALCAGSIGGVQGWHYVNVRSWGNEGENGGDYTYGPLGYDTIPPVTTPGLSGSLISGTTYKSAVTVTLSASDPGYPSTGSGVSITYYYLNSGGWQVYSGPFSVPYTGSYTVHFFSNDKAGNAETLKTVSFTIKPAVSVSPATLAFGNEVLGTTSAGKSVTLTNITGSSVSLSAPTASGDYTVSANTCGASLTAGGHCSITVTFKPSIVGGVSGDLTFAYSGGVGSPDRIGLAGTGLVPLAASPTSLAFGTVTVGTTSAAKTLTLKNDNPSTALSIKLAYSNDYATSGGTCGASLAGGASCTVNVTFTPHQNGAINGAVSVTDGVAQSPLVVALSGSGSGGVAFPLTFSPTSASFTNVVVGTSASKSVTVKNVSASSVNITSILGSGDYSASGCITTLLPSATCVLTVKFNPSTTGSIKGAIAVKNNTSVNPDVLNASGTAILPVTISPTSINLGTWIVGTTSSWATVMVTNHTTSAVSIAYAASGDFSAVTGGGTPCSSSLAAGAQCTFLVNATPTTTGPVTGVTTITYSGGYSPQEVKLSATGQ